ncbi:MAG TPA: peptidoglycan DD-metalloendopeptidase family protein [Candidatus Coprenecus stercoravium]|uniref:Peptidoglycan DD-metalloendopeptidase family protein n=1 Tax=Candidatus Coprenecus stercoravium TaxID=2840735 RepID=A0A9D2GQ63_9BACT|nr:peptidoglycan DD-metalloendopeptidase family protein [Candidatus Coprenecus stercoravium]
MKRAVLLVVMATCLSVLSSQAQDISRQQEQKKQIEQEIALIDKQLDANADKRKKSLNTLILTRRKLEARKKLIEQIDRDITGYDHNIAVTNSQIDRLNDRLDTLRKYHEALVMGTYKTRDNKVWFMYILSSKDINQGLRRWSYLKNISRSVRRQAEQIRTTEEELRTENARLEELRDGSVKAKAEREREKEALSAEEKKMNSLVVQLTKEEKSMRKELKQKQKQVEQLNKEIERILAEAVRRQQAGKGAEIDYALSARFGENKGKLPWPVRGGIIIQKFGQTFHPIFKNLKMPYNNGVNISAPAGSKATAVFNGVVKQILVMPGYDQCVLVQHGEYFTFYCKLRQVYVKSGDSIDTGDAIGEISLNDDGNSELHFQLWKGTEKQNPETWLRK